MPAFATIRRALRHFRHRPATAEVGPPLTADDVRRAYRTLLGRPPESEDAIRSALRRCRTVPELIRQITESAEFGYRWDAALSSDNSTRTATGTASTDYDVIAAFEPYTGPGTPGFITDFLGVKTRVAFIHGLAPWDGRVEDVPIPGNFHAPSYEWAGVLRSVLDAQERYVAIELGAGWGPWLVSAATAANRRGITDVRLVGVEAAATHYEFLCQHFVDNGLAPDRHRLLLGAATAEDGFVEFPDLSDAPADYGATLHVGDALLDRGTRPSVTRVPGYSLETLLAPFDAADLVHVDIQGSEADVVSAARDVLKKKVWRLVIGTHGRAVEQRLLEVLSADGWRLESDHACRYAPGECGLGLAEDGCQVWRNPRGMECR